MGATLRPRRAARKRPRQRQLGITKPRRSNDDGWRIGFRRRRRRRAFARVRRRNRQRALVSAASSGCARIADDLRQRLRPTIRRGRSRRTSRAARTGRRLRQAWRLYRCLCAPVGARTTVLSRRDHARPLRGTHRARPHPSASHGRSDHQRIGGDALIGNRRAARRRIRQRTSARRHAFSRHRLDAPRAKLRRHASAQGRERELRHRHHRRAELRRRMRGRWYEARHVRVVEGPETRFGYRARFRARSPIHFSSG
jgi:hypothetical protein